jgi:nucleotide-binding universal stress UspA family protein
MSRLILVVANETVESDVLHETVYFLAHNPPGEVIVVAPALNSRLRYWLSDEDRAREEAEARLRRCLDRLEDAGIEARGWVGDADPMQAVADIMHVFAPDEIVIATHPRGRSHWLAENLVERVRARYPRPVLHLVADPLIPQRAMRAA